MLQMKHRRRGRPLKPLDASNIGLSDKPFDTDGPLHHEKGGLTINGLRRLLILTIESSNARSISEWAEQNRIAHPTEVYMFLRGRRPPSSSILMAMGYNREPIFIRKAPVGVDRKIHSTL